jgi:hypothetical protein
MPVQENKRLLAADLPAVNSLTLSKLIDQSTIISRTLVDTISNKMRLIKHYFYTKLN